MDFFFYLIVIFLFLIVILFFSSQTLSPIPYFPSNKKDLPLIIKALNLKNNQLVFDLGAGDGIVIFKAAKKAFEKKLNTKFFAVEINPVLILIMIIRRLFHPNKKNIKIIRADIFTINFKKLVTKPVTRNPQPVTFYLYISPWYLEKVIKNLKLKIKNFALVSYFYSVPKMRAKKVFEGKNKIFIY
jgi:16S rRNA A1518/A1519 N6-dimethyltransferase RsmA/KsgA/DIM1 with predicted DNA glycosylase/AP lyase activity